LSLPLLAPAAPAQAQRRTLALQPLIGHRVLLVLPLQTGPQWGGNTLFTQAMLPGAQRMLERALTNTGRYSVVAVNRFNPVLQRGATDEAFSQDELTTLLTQPTVENARPVVSKLTFGSPPKLRFAEPPLIAEFILNRVMVNGAGGTTVEVAGRFYDPLMVEPYMAFTVIGAPQTGLVGNTIARGAAGYAPAVATNSANTAFARIAQESLKPAAQLEAPLMANPRPLTPVGGAPAEGAAADAAATEETATP
jgi:hypothetical protein